MLGTGFLHSAQPGNSQADHEDMDCNIPKENRQHAAQHQHGYCHKIPATGFPPWTPNIGISSNRTRLLAKACDVCCSFLGRPPCGIFQQHDRVRNARRETTLPNETVTCLRLFNAVAEVPVTAHASLVNPPHILCSPSHLHGSPSNVETQPFAHAKACAGLHLCVCVSVHQPWAIPCCGQDDTATARQSDSR